MVGSTYFVKSTPPRAFSISFQYFVDSDKLTAFFNIVIFDHCLYTIMAGSAYFVKSTSPRAFSISFQYFADMFHTY